MCEGIERGSGGVREREGIEGTGSLAARVRRAQRLGLGDGWADRS